MVAIRVFAGVPTVLLIFFPPSWHLHLLIPLSCLGRAVQPGNTKEAVSCHRQASQDDGPRQSNNEEGKKVW